jgi:DNA primase catalytic subunit
MDPIGALVFTYTWPRLDVEVTKQMTHLLKSPWVVHPTTGRICVPIDRRNFDQFNPEKVPTLHQLQTEEFTDETLQSYKFIFEKFVRRVTELQLRADGQSSSSTSSPLVTNATQNPTSTAAALVPTQLLSW